MRGKLPRNRPQQPPSKPRPRKQPPAVLAAQAEEDARRVAMWDALANCETGGNWQNGGDYGGGLGIYVGTWKMYGGHEFADAPATRVEGTPDRRG